MRCDWRHGLGRCNSPMTFSQILAYVPVIFLIGLMQAYMVALFRSEKGAKDKAQMEAMVTAAAPFICAGFAMAIALSYVELPNPWGVVSFAATCAVLALGIVWGMRTVLVQKALIGPQGDRLSLAWAAATTVLWALILAQSSP